MRRLFEDSQRPQRDEMAPYQLLRELRPHPLRLQQVKLHADTPVRKLVSTMCSGQVPVKICQESAEQRRETQQAPAQEIDGKNRGKWNGAQNTGSSQRPLGRTASSIAEVRRCPACVIPRPSKLQTAPQGTSAERSDSVIQSAASGGVIEGELLSEGRLRFYRLYVPTTPGSPAPVVVVLHGGLQTPEGIAEMTGFDAKAESKGFLAVYPAGIGRTFNAGECCGTAQALGVDDIGFVGDLVEHLDETYEVDRARVYATGISNGGLLGYRLACERPDMFAGVAPVAATLIGSCDPATPVSILHIHGLLDKNVPFKGGPGSQGFADVDWPPVMRGLQRWRRIDGCDSDPSTKEDGPVTHRHWTECRDGTDVVLYKLADGGHSWPGGQPVPDPLGPTSQSLNATKKIWHFSKEHPHD
jgi:polyhydroxybutyrate depolymerase